MSGVLRHGIIHHGIIRHGIVRRGIVRRGIVRRGIKAPHHKIQWLVNRFRYADMSGEDSASLPTRYEAPTTLAGDLSFSTEVTGR